MSSVFVDTDGLVALASRMARTRDEVARAARLVEDSGPAAGLLAGALADFEDHWRYGLTRIVGNLEACRDALRAAATDYERVEHAVARAACGE